MEDVIYIYTHIHTYIFIHSSIDGHLDCFHIITIINNTMNIEVHVSFQLIFSFSSHLYIQQWNCWQFYFQFFFFFFFGKLCGFFLSGGLNLQFHQKCFIQVSHCWYFFFFFFFFFFFEKPLCCFPQWMHQFTIPSKMCQGSLFSTSLPAFAFVIYRPHYIQMRVEDQAAHSA